tara:strand:+ start:5064 stop:6311 length:1248 start_codon:yes stop_codon:yes gene_type:complete
MAKFSDAEKLDIVFKKNFGKPSTDTSLAFYSEPSFDARPRVFQSQIYANDIPTTAPTDFGSVSEGASGASSANSHIKYYNKWELVQVTPGNNQAFKGPADGSVDNILQNSIPFNYDTAGGYAVELKDYEGNVISDGTGEWVIDPDAGILTFHEYADVSSYVNSTDKLPYLSFYRYAGETGSSNLFTESSNFIYPNTTSHTVVIGASSLSDASNALEVTGTSIIDGTLKATEVIATSDKKLKKNIKKFKNALTKLDQIKGVSFKWKKTNEKSYGVIAQDVEIVLPDAVNTDYDGNKAVNYNSIVALLVESVKNINNKYNQLEDKYNKLKNIILDVIDDDNDDDNEDDYDNEIDDNNDDDDEEPQPKTKKKSTKITPKTQPKTQPKTKKKSNKFKCNCGKEYKYKSGLSNHKKKCKK